MRREQDRARSATFKNSGAHSATIEYYGARSATIKSRTPGAHKLARDENVPAKRVDFSSYDKVVRALIVSKSSEDSKLLFNIWYFFFGSYF